MAEFSENVIEWLTGDDTISVTVSQKRFVNRIKRLSFTDKNVVILAENPDASIFAHLPLSYLKLSPKTSSNWTEEQKAACAARLRKPKEAKS